MIKKIKGVFALVLLAGLSLFPIDAADLYWEEAALFSSGRGSFPVSAYSNEFSAVAWQEVTHNPDPGIAASGLINVHLAVKENNRSWEQRGMIAGPYHFSGTEPSILSMVIDNRGRIIIAAAEASTQTVILISNDRGRTFTRNAINTGTENSVAPRIFVRADGGYLLFVTRGLAQSLSIYYSRSSDGISWTPFEFFTPESSLALNFLPVHSSIGRRDIVFFQSLAMGIDAITTFQLYFKTSDDGGATWTPAMRFTTFNDPVIQTQAPANSFDNQRPHLTRYGNNLLLVWERRYSTQQPQIYSAEINANAEIVPGSVHRVNSEEAYCHNPIAFMYENIPTVVWFDNRRGNNRVVLAQYMDFSWQNHLLSSAAVDSSFARPVVTRDGAYIFWQGIVRGTDRIFLLSPDRSVDSPRIAALNFTPSRATRSERARVSWNIPSDTSGIFGFSWSWSQNERETPPREVMVYNTGTTQNLNMEHHATREGAWYFTVSAQDFAGNWSEPSRVMFFRKTQPPPEVTINEPQLDANGYITSNNFNLSWQPSTDPFVAGYTWNLQYLGNNRNAAINPPPPSIQGTNRSVSYNNQDDGYWGFTVAAIDQAGNIGPPSHITFNANKFVPYTSISFVDANQNEQGILEVRLVGRGFSTDGVIDSIVLAQEGKPDIPSDFTILSDREITGLRFEHMDEGHYYLKLNHSSRGSYSTNQIIPAVRTGTVKSGDYTNEWKPSWIIHPQGLITINPVSILAIILIIFCVLGSTAAIRGISGIITESAAIRQETIAIITGDFMPSEKKQKIIRIQKRGRGLRFKLASFTIILVLLVTAMISMPMYYIMTQSQRQTLLQGLWDRSTVLLEGIASSSRSFMPMAIRSGGEQGLIELGYLPAQSAALPEAHYVTITGYGLNSIYSDHVWATNDPDILDKIDTSEFRAGVSRITDELSPQYDAIKEELDQSAREAAGDLSRSIRDLTEEGMMIATRLDTASQQRLSDIQVTIRSLDVRVTEILTQLSGGIKSDPFYSTETITRTSEMEYIFYKPVMYRLGTDDNYFRGLIRLKVSLNSIMDAILNDQIILLQTILIVALAAILIGIIGALIFSTLIIRPIRKLVSHIEVIRDTEDKAKLAGVDIHIPTSDEIAILGNTINDMTHGLVKAALAASDLSVGKEIQKKFIPLEVDNQGNKQSSGFKKTQNLNFFGYYEGAKGVSGDYFDYKDLDGRYYAIIKCDVAGKGIPAALIMIQVATMFLNHFKQWKPNEKGMKIDEVVYQINDFIETLAFKGRFAAFTLCIFDSETGLVRFCNAGDNIVHLYDASEGKIKTITLPTTPATGVLPNFMIESTGGYKVQTVTVDHGDILLLYTDGIEEAKRKFRNKDFKEIICEEGEIDTPHENHLCGQADEEMSPERVEAIINAVMAKEMYTLKKYHNPEGDDDELQFDFTKCESRVEDVIMAMVSVEKIFRCYKDPNAGEDSRVLTDKKVDEFLKNHFLQYRRYCAHTREHPENPAYIYYTHVKEDEQYDDLTILGIKRK